MESMGLILEPVGGRRSGRRVVRGGEGVGENEEAAAKSARLVRIKKKQIILICNFALISKKVDVHNI